MFSEFLQLAYMGMAVTTGALFPLCILWVIRWVFRSVSGAEEYKESWEREVRDNPYIKGGK